MISTIRPKNCESRSFCNMKNLPTQISSLSLYTLKTSENLWPSGFLVFADGIEYRETSVA